MPRKPTLQPTQAKPGAARAVLGAFSTLMSRLNLQNFGNTYGGDRKMAEILGYKTSLSCADYTSMYERTPLGQRIVESFPAATWRRYPEVKENENENALSPFEAAWEAISKKNNLFNAMERADNLARLGRYGVILIGLVGQSSLETEAAPSRNLKGPDALAYLTPFGESNAEIESYVTDPGNPRFGQPLIYRIKVEIGSGDTKNIRVHHSRVIHFAENALDNPIFGRPALRACFDCLQDVIKTVGGGAEAFWRTAMTALNADVKDDYDLTPDAEAALEDELTEFYNNMRRTIRTKGIDLKPMDMNAADPTGIFQALLSLIATAANMPVRILIGSERGELASSQDERAWRERIMERQTNFCEPMILRTLIDRLILLGILPPSENYEVCWPDLNALDSEQQVDIAAKCAGALQSYCASPEAQIIVPVEEFRQRYLGLEPEPDGGFPSEPLAIVEPPVDPNTPDPEEAVPGKKTEAAA